MLPRPWRSNMEVEIPRYFALLVSLFHSWETGNSWQCPRSMPCAHSNLQYYRVWTYVCPDGKPAFIIQKGVSLGLTHWGRVTHICVSTLTIIGSDNGLLSDRRQAIISTKAGLLLTGPLGRNFSENLIEILTFPFTKMRLKVSSAKQRPFCLGLNVLRVLANDGSYFCHALCRGSGKS